MTQLLQPIIDVLRWVLDFFNGYVHSWGWSIILLTLTVRVVLIPLTHKQTKAMKDIQRIQPLVKELQEKYKNDREKLAQAQMDLYKEHKVSPFGGCLPLILQMPIFFALFTLLRQPIFKGQGFGPLGDLSKSASGVGLGDIAAAWPYYLLIILIVATQYVSQKQTTTDPQQAKMMAFMPVIIGVISFSLPAGVLLYWTVFNAFMILQQWVEAKFFNRQQAPAASAKATLPEAKKAPANSLKSKGKKKRGSKGK